MTDKLTPGEALQKILDALGVDDLNLNSRGLFEDYIRQAASAESTKKIEQLEADIGGLEDLLRLERDKNTRILRESDAEIERLKRVVEAASAVAEMYIDIANSGDAGFWNPEEVPQVIIYRAATKKEG